MPELDQTHIFRKLGLTAGLCLAVGCYRTPHDLVCPTDDGTLLGTLALTPRADRNLELLALHIESSHTSFGSGGARKLVARQETYERVVRDVAAARALEPELENVPFAPRNDGRTMMVTLTKDAYGKFERGEFRELDCFFDTYGGDIVGALPRAPNARTVLIRFDGVYDLRRILSEIIGGRVRGIHIGITGLIDEEGLPTTSHDGPTICVQGLDSTWHYVFVDTDGPCEDRCTTATNYYVTTDPDGSITLQDTFEEGTNAIPPGWMTSFRKHDLCGGKPYSSTWM